MKGLCLVMFAFYVQFLLALLINRKHEGKVSFNAVVEYDKWEMDFFIYGFDKLQILSIPIKGSLFIMYSFKSSHLMPILCGTPSTLISNVLPYSLSFYN